jgi:hypothetical protein
MTFEPITSQEQFDAIFTARLARAKQKWEKESGLEDMRAQLEAKDDEIGQIQREHFHEAARRELVSRLKAGGVDSERRIERIMRHVDLDEIEADPDGAPNSIAIDGQLQSIHDDLPELLPEKFQMGAGSGYGSKERVNLDREPPLTADEVEAMSEEEINSNWDRVQGFLAGKR